MELGSGNLQAGARIQYMCTEATEKILRQLTCWPPEFIPEAAYKLRRHEKRRQSTYETIY